jgi:hypothetical protein
VLGARVAKAIAPFLATVLVPSPWSTLISPPFRTTHVALSNFWVPIQSLCKGGDYATLVPP